MSLLLIEFFFSSGLGWVGGGGGVGWVFYFVDTVLFCRTVFVGRWVAMVLTSSSCNLGIDNFDSRQVPNILEFYLLAKEFSYFILFIYLIYLQFCGLISQIFYKLLFLSAVIKCSRLSIL